MNIILDSNLAKLSGNDQKSHDFTIRFIENIILDKNRNYKAALDELLTMSYSWDNIRETYGNNKLKWRKTGASWKTITFPDGMYDYVSINNLLQSYMGLVNSKNIIRVYFDSTIYKAVILLADGYELDISQGNFADLLGFNKEILSSQNNVGERVPNITRGVDWAYIHCDLISREVDNIGSDVLFVIPTTGLDVSYPFSKEPRRLHWHTVNKQQISSIRIYVTDGRNNILDMNDQNLTISIMIKEE